MRHLEFNEHNFNVLQQAYDELKAKYDERGAAMRESGTVVRSLFTPYLRRIRDAVCWQDLPKAVTEIQNALDELGKHTTF